MEIPGIESILYKHGGVGWPSEDSHAFLHAEKFDETTRKLDHGRFKDAVKLLDELARADDDLQPSQQMRRRYLQGRLFASLEDWMQALSFYEMAQSLAKEHSDFDSSIVLAICTAEAIHETLQFVFAQEDYEFALSVWRDIVAKRYATPDVAPREPEVTLLTFIGREMWLVGEFEHAREQLARALTLARQIPRASRSNQLKLMTAHALWMLGLVLRSQSDMRDGDLGFLKGALRRMRTATILYTDASVDSQNMGRFYVQIGEIYLDIAELHLLEGGRDTARVARHEARNFAQTAADFLAPSADPPGMLLADLTQLRHDIMWRPERASGIERLEIAARLSQIEHDPYALKDAVMLAKAASVRGEWLLLLGETEQARMLLELAVEGFHAGGMGMATRAQRLLRRIDPASSSGGKWRASGGPTIGPLKVADPSDDDLN